jgi:hypothetical protein
MKDNFLEILLALINSNKGRFIGLEGKFGTNKASALQLHHIEEIKKAGGIAGTIYTLEDVDSLLLELDNRVLISNT